MDDKLTTKQAITVLRNLQDWLYYSSMNGGTSIQREAIDIAIKALEAEPHWIPVTERLPETDDEVLTTYIVNGNRKKRYVETSRYYDGFDGQWSSPWDEYRIPGTRIEVIAWMPLPESFKG